MSRTGRYELTLYPRPGGVAISWDHFNDLRQAEAEAGSQPYCEWTVIDHGNHRRVVARSLRA